ncbi:MULTISPECIES: DNA modification methylase [unclassified Methylobacterium]|uniref:DNA modification methylase n=1 Tax=unclassified Methylobacterium TaxID=2615210 RepID=UPI00226A4E92|nr:MULTISPECIES: DNA modification methylase [unclassified Methylobacterium]
MSRNLKAALLKRDAERRARRKQPASVPSLTTPRRNDLMPNLCMVRRDPANLRPAERKIHKLDETHVAQIAACIATVGFVDPVLIDTDDRILDGVSRVEAAKRLGLETIPCVLVEVTTPEQWELIRLGVNVLSEKATYDLASIAVILRELVVAGAPIEVVGIDTVLIDAIRLGDEDDEPDPADLVPNPAAIGVTRQGDVFSCGDHRVVCGDAREAADWLGKLAVGPVRLVLTDIPYNVAIAGHVTRGDHREFAMASGEMSDEQFARFNDAWMSQAAECLVDGGLLATFIDWRGLSAVDRAAGRLGLEQLNLIVWGKTNAGMGGLYRSQHELMPLFKKGHAPHRNNVKLGQNGRWRTNLWTYPGASTAGSDARRGLADHPTVKPVAMLKDALLDVTDRGETVLDPFLGSGSTLIAAELTGRRCVGIEIDPLYVDLIIRRFEDTTKTEAVHLQSGETFAALASRRASEPAPVRSGSATSDGRRVGRSRPARGS